MIRNSFVKTWRDSATLILVAKDSVRCNDKFKILMLKRSAKSKFMPSSYVYPGGVTVASDFSKEWIDLLKLKDNSFEFLPNEKYQRPFDYCFNAEKKHLDIAFRICALRETFEESGLLLVKDQNGKKVMFSNPDDHLGGKYITLGEWRENINKDGDTFLELFRNLPFVPDVSSLLEWSMWLTPSFLSKRFFTMFYICFVDSILSQSNDDAEIVDSDWLNPLDALKAHSRNGLNLQPPQVYESWRLASYSSFDDLENFAQRRVASGLDLWCPFKIKCNDGYIVTYPGDNLHNNNPYQEHAQMNCLVEELHATNVNRLLETNGSTESNLICNVNWFGHPAFGVKSSNFNPHDDECKL